MPLLPNARHERFAQELASGKSATQAYISAGYSKTGADGAASRLLGNVSVRNRVDEIKQSIAGSVIRLAIRDADCRVSALQDRWERLTRVITERAADPTMQSIPGGSTGLLVRQLKQVGSGRDAQLVEEYAVDTGMLRETRAHEEQAAKELGQWDEKRPSAGAGIVPDFVITVKEKAAEIRLHGTDRTTESSIPVQ